MKRVLIATLLATVGTYGAYAQDATPPSTEVSPPAADSAHPPENRMDAATPTMKAPSDDTQLPPTGRVGESVPPMKSTDQKDDNAAAAPETSPAPTAAAPSAMPSLVVTDEEAKNWIGRPVYGSDDKKIGEIAELKRDGDNKVTEIDLDAGGFLGFGATRYRASADQIQDVKSDRLVLKITSAETENLPAVATK
jgi:hypothetical protein